MLEKYRPSGLPGIWTIPLWCLATVVAVGLAYVYQIGLYWIPFIYLNFLMTMGMGYACNWLSTTVVRLGPCRNVMMAVGMALTLSIVALAAKHWFQYEAYYAEIVEFALEEEGPAQDRDQLAQRIRENFTFADYIEVRVEEGWQFGNGNGAPAGGVIVYIVWLIEAGIIVGLSVVGSYSQARHPFHEMLMLWADEEENVAQIPCRDEATLDAIRCATMTEDLFALPARDPAVYDQFLIYRINSIPGADMEDAFLSIVLMTETRNKKGEITKKEKSIHDFVVLKKSQREQLMAVIEGPPIA